MPVRRGGGVMNDNFCMICGEPVAGEPAQAAHLTAKHPGPFKFHYDARPYSTDKPSMLVQDLLKLVGGNVQYLFYEHLGTDAHVFYAQAQAVDLTREPWFYSIPPATY
jgi:hypothetical protein